MFEKAERVKHVLEGIVNEVENFYTQAKVIKKDLKDIKIHTDDIDNVIAYFESAEAYSKNIEEYLRGFIDGISTTIGDDE